MARWRLRDVGSFPPDFLRALRDSPGERKIVGLRFTLKAIRALQINWQVYCYCIREKGEQGVRDLEANFSHRTKVEWNEMAGKWCLYLNSRPREEEDEVAKILRYLD